VPYDADKLKRMDREAVQLYLLRFIHDRYQRHNDNLLATFCSLVRRYSDEVDAATKEAIYRFKLQASDDVEQGAKILALFLDPSIDGQTPFSAVRDRALRNLEESSREGRVVSGLEAVAVAATAGAQGTLLVEDDFRVRGSVAVAPRSPLVSKEVDIRDVNDDAVDEVIERVLGHGGNVVFMQEGALADRQRIAMLLSAGAPP